MSETGNKGGWMQGPWRVSHRYDETSVVGPDDDLIFAVHGADEDEVEANARLGRAAPEMYRALVAARPALINAGALVALAAVDLSLIAAGVAIEEQDHRSRTPLATDSYGAAREKVLAEIALTQKPTGAP